MTQIMARATTLLDNRKNVKMTSTIYLRAIIPIGVLYCGSLVCSNLPYLTLSVVFIQMLKVRYSPPFGDCKTDIRRDLAQLLSYSRLVPWDLILRLEEMGEHCDHSPQSYSRFLWRDQIRHERFSLSDGRNLL
jgi:hypothetical protein